MGKQPTIADEASLAGVTETRNLKGFYQTIEKALNAGRKIHFLPPYRSEITLKLQDILGIPAKIIPDSGSITLIQAIVSQRSIKSDEEISEIEKAVNTSVDMHVAAMKMVRPGMKELEVASEMEKIALNGGGFLSFPVIATINGQDPS